MRTGFTGEALAFQTTLLDDANLPVTGAVNGDWTKVLYANGVVSAVTATVTELASGVYAVSYTPDAPGRWYLRYTHADGAVFDDEAEVSLDATVHAAIVDDGGTLHVRAWMMRSGRQVLNASQAVVSVRDESDSEVAALTIGSDDANGYFVGTVSLVPTDNRAYAVRVAVTDPLGTVTAARAAIAVATGA